LGIDTQPIYLSFIQGLGPPASKRESRRFTGSNPCELVREPRALSWTE